MGILKPGTAFAGRYEIVRILSAGGMGAVYEVIHQETRRHLALKVMLPSALADDDIRERFRREASVTSTVESEHIVEVLDAGVEDATGSPFLVMELLRGEDLGKRLRARGPMNPAEAIELFTQLARGLARTHEANIVHRDLKPENIFLTKRDDGSMRAKILDFGIAKLVSKTQGTSTRSLGTPLFMSPEQMEGIAADIGPATDLYALGHVAFAVLAGRPYYQSDAERADNILSLLLQIAKGATDPASVRAAAFGVRLPSAFDAWFSRSTHRDPSSRFASVGEMVSALALVLDGRPSAALPVEANELDLAPPRAADAAASIPPIAEPMAASLHSSTPPAPSMDELALALTSPAAVAGPTTPPDPLPAVDEPARAEPAPDGIAVSRSPIAIVDAARSNASRSPAVASRIRWIFGAVGGVIALAVIGWSAGLFSVGPPPTAARASLPSSSPPEETLAPQTSVTPRPSAPTTTADPISSMTVLSAAASVSTRSAPRPSTTATRRLPEIVGSPDGR